MSDSATLAAVVRELQAARDGGRQIPPLAGRTAGFDVDAGYAVADALHRERLRRGARAVGRKIGFTNPAMWARYGVDAPIWGHVYDLGLFDAAHGEARCSLGPYVEPRIEPELVLHFGRTPPPRASVADIAAAVDWVALGFEIVQSHFPGWRFAAADTVADGALHGALLLGAPLPLARCGGDAPAALAAVGVTLSCDGVVRERGCGANVLGGPLQAAAHLVALLHGQPAAPPLQAGELVSTGTLTLAHAVAAGERWRAEADGLPLAAVAVEFLR